jgi:hypothetical protein
MLAHNIFEYFFLSLWGASECFFSKNSVLEVNTCAVNCVRLCVLSPMSEATDRNVVILGV